MHFCDDQYAPAELHNSRVGQKGAIINVNRNSLLLILFLSNSITSGCQFFQSVSVSEKSETEEAPERAKRFSTILFPSLSDVLKYVFSSSKPQCKVKEFSFLSFFVCPKGCPQLQCGRKVKGRCGVLNVERRRCLPACGSSLPFWVFRAPRGVPIKVKIDITGDFLGDRVLVRDGQLPNSRRIAKCIAGGGHCPPVLLPIGRFVRIEIRPKNRRQRCLPFILDEQEPSGYNLSISIIKGKWISGIF